MNAINIEPRRRRTVLLLTVLAAASIVFPSADLTGRSLATAATTTSMAESPSRIVDANVASNGAGGNRRLMTTGTEPHRVSETPLGMPPASSRAHPRPDGGVVGGYVAPKPGKHGKSEEVQNGEGQNAYSSKQLLYKGGAVQTSPRIYLVFWGANWFSGGDPYGVATRLDLFYRGIGGSTFSNALKQFTSNYGAFTNPVGQYKGWLQDKTAIPARPTKIDIASAAKRAAKAANDYSYNTQYVIALPWGYVDDFSTSNSFCAWHDYTYATSSNWITYTAMPYIPYEDYIGRGCGKGWVNGTNGTLDGVTILASHEYAETVNDPSLNAWSDSDGSENADKCSWTNVQNRQLANGYWFPVQPYWSNSWSTTYGYGCYYS